MSRSKIERVIPAGSLFSPTAVRPYATPEFWNSVSENRKPGAPHKKLKVDVFGDFSFFFLHNLKVPSCLNKRSLKSLGKNTQLQHILFNQCNFNCVHNFGTTIKIEI